MLLSSTTSFGSNNTLHEEATVRLWGATAGHLPMLEQAAFHQVLLGLRQRVVIHHAARTLLRHVELARRLAARVETGGRLRC